MRGVFIISRFESREIQNIKKIKEKIETQKTQSTKENRNTEIVEKQPHKQYTASSRTPGTRAS